MYAQCMFVFVHTHATVYHGSRHPGIRERMFSLPLLGDYRCRDGLSRAQTEFHCERCGVKEADLCENKDDIRAEMFIRTGSLHVCLQERERESLCLSYSH